MYARYILLQLGPESRQAAEHLSETADPVYRAQPGFKSVAFLLDDATGECASLSVFETEAQARAAADVLRPLLLRLVGDKLQAQPQAHFFEVYEPKGERVAKRRWGLSGLFRGT